MKNVFNSSDANELIHRIHSLDKNTSAQWGKMNVGQMLAHCNVPYEMIYTDKHPRPNGFVKFMIKLFAKSYIVGSNPYKKNSRTSPQFLITSNREFDHEKNRLLAHLQKTLELGVCHFDGKESHSLGRLSADEWNSMFFKHLNHHLNQFGV